MYIPVYLYIRAFYEKAQIPPLHHLDVYNSFLHDALEKLSTNWQSSKLRAVPDGTPKNMEKTTQMGKAQSHNR